MNITEAAKAQIEKFLLAEEEKKVFRVSVNTGGCSGFKYETALDVAKEGDFVIIWDKCRSGRGVAIDPISLPFLESVTMDYVDTIGHSSFVFDNPDASSTCGCGISFDA